MNVLVKPQLQLYNFMINDRDIFWVCVIKKTIPEFEDKVKGHLPLNGQQLILGNDAFCHTLFAWENFVIL